MLPKITSQIQPVTQEQPVPQEHQEHAVDASQSPTTSPVSLMPHVTDAQPKALTDGVPVTTRSDRTVRRPAYLNDFCV